MAVSLLVALLALPTQTSSSPNVNRTTHGYIRQDEIWRGEMHVTGDIVVNEGVTLTIEPGTTVLIAANSDANNLFKHADMMKQGLNTAEPNHPAIFLGEPYYDESNHIQIAVMGTLHAVGTPDQMITITSDSPNPTMYDWTGLEVWNGIMSYTIVEYYRSFGPLNGVLVSHCLLRHAGGCAVCFADPEAAAGVVIEHSTISYAAHELIDTHSPCDVIIRNNHIGPNPSMVNPGGYEEGGNGIVLDGGAPEIVGNTIEGCESAINFIVPPAIPYEKFIPQLCRDNDIIANYVHIRDHHGNSRSCDPTAD